MTDDVTARLALDFIRPGQSQKESAHNEAMTRIDLLLHGAVEGVGTIDPPDAPTPGQAWIVGAGATGAWSGREDMIAGWTDGGWRFVAPITGMRLISRIDGTTVDYGDAGWIAGELRAARILIDGVAVIGGQGAAIAEPTGGAIVDAEARLALAAVLAAMRTHGLIAAS